MKLMTPRSVVTIATGLRWLLSYNGRVRQMTQRPTCITAGWSAGCPCGCCAIGPRGGTLPCEPPGKSGSYSYISPIYTSVSSSMYCACVASCRQRMVLE